MARIICPTPKKCGVAKYHTKPGVCKADAVRQKVIKAANNPSLKSSADKQHNPMSPLKLNNMAHAAETLSEAECLEASEHIESMMLDKNLDLNATLDTINQATLSGLHADGSEAVDDSAKLIQKLIPADEVRKLVHGTVNARREQLSAELDKVVEQNPENKEALSALAESLRQNPSGGDGGVQGTLNKDDALNIISTLESVEDEMDYTGELATDCYNLRQLIQRDVDNETIYQPAD